LDVKNITSAWDNKGDIIVGNDVWIGKEAVFMSVSPLAMEQSSVHRQL
jgi:acetyltransferase-like isoleucine patch superfamily enzyme